MYPADTDFFLLFCFCHYIFNAICPEHILQSTLAISDTLNNFIFLNPSVTR